MIIKLIGLSKTLSVDIKQVWMAVNAEEAYGHLRE